MDTAWKKECQKQGKWDYYPTDPKSFRERWGRLLSLATINETMGPLWKPIVWVNQRPFVFREKVRS